MPDGLKVDAEGRVHWTGFGGVRASEEDGGYLSVIELPEYPASLAWRGEDRQTACFTCNTPAYSARMATPARRSLAFSNGAWGSNREGEEVIHPDLTRALVRASDNPRNRPQLCYSCGS